jgi:hypothetical protein
VFGQLTQIQQAVGWFEKYVLLAVPALRHVNGHAFQDYTG